MRKILILASMLTMMNATDICEMYINATNKNLEKGLHSKSKNIKEIYIRAAIQAQIDAKYNCPTSMEDDFTIRIERLEDILVRMEG